GPAQMLSAPADPFLPTMIEGIAVKGVVVKPTTPFDPNTGVGPEVLRSPVASPLPYLKSSSCPTVAQTQPRGSELPALEASPTRARRSADCTSPANCGSSFPRTASSRTN